MMTDTMFSYYLFKFLTDSLVEFIKVAALVGVGYCIGRLQIIKPKDDKESKGDD